ncbi:uncharacterized protein APUU_80763A [Aspergillus puulaauensis]|uniref:Ankyrin repeat-containing domain protein n=1 Tax=Aspergillus puulaauensis TaxID=1220207 RepID=A0A7R8AV27_9EURO|nr:uncharacterized protein APUU_80763A [Aspergillus puulaauensis]BCS30460.1 hypothetical protein APUU_80763A [Aspergillus puulaauensis]
MQLIWLDMPKTLDYCGISFVDLQKYKKLVSSSQAGDISAVRTLLQAGVSPNPPGTSLVQMFPWFSPLQAASRGNHREVITLLREFGAKLPKHDSNAEMEATDVLRLLCTGDTDGETVSLLARHARNAGIEWDGKRLAHQACTLGLDLSRISNLISSNLWSDELAPYTSPQYTPIVSLISGPLDRGRNPSPEDYKVLRFMLSDEERRNNPCNFEGHYPIHQAVSNGGVETVRILLQEFGADPNCFTNTRVTPLRLAVDRLLRIESKAGGEDSFAILKLLLDSGASPRDNADTFTYAVLLDSPAVRILFDTWVARFGLRHDSELLLTAAAALGDVPMIQRLLLLCDAQPSLFRFHSKAPALDKATKFNHYEAAKVLLPHITPDALQSTYNRSYSLTSALHRAIEHSNEAIVQLLLSCYRTGELLHCSGLICTAILYQPPSIVSMILDLVPGPISSYYAQYILDFAAAARNYEVLLLLIDHIESHEIVSDPTPDTVAILGDWGPRQRLANPLVTAVENSHRSVVQAVIKHWPGYVNEKTAGGIWPLLMAVWSGRRDIVRVLLAAGADPKACYTPPTDPALPSGSSLMWEAAFKGHTHIMEQLVASGCDVDARHPGLDDWTLLSWASCRGPASLVRALLEHKANVHERDSKGRTALSFAAIHGRADIVRILIQAGACVNAVDNQGRTPLILALKHGIDLPRRSLFHGCEPRPAEVEKKVEDKVHAARVLLDSGADMSMMCQGQGHHGARRCHCLAEIRHLPLLQFYFDHGLTIVDEVDDRGRTLMHYAVESGNHAMVRFLVSAGFDIFKADGEGNTPLYFASDDEMVGILYWKR